MRRDIDALVAVCVAVGVNLAIVWTLTRVASVEAPVARQASDAIALQVVWIKRREVAKANPLPRAADPVKRSARRKPAHSLVVAPAKSPDVVEPGPQAGPTPELRLNVPPPRPIDFQRNPLARRQDLSRPNAMPGIVMRDNSFLGKLAGMSGASACGELRTLLKSGQGSLANRGISVESVLRSMEERGCSF